MLELVDVERPVQLCADNDTDDCSGKASKGKPPEDRSLYRAFLKVRDHRQNPRPQREQQIRANGLIGTDAEKDQQRRRDRAGTDAAVSSAGADDESDHNVLPVHRHLMASTWVT